jgi:hypothetical protein
MEQAQSIKDLDRRRRARERELVAEENRRAWKELRPLLSPEVVAMLSQPAVITPPPTEPATPTPDDRADVLKEIHAGVLEIRGLDAGKGHHDQGDGTSTEAAQLL